MATVTITNISSEKLVLRDLYVEIEPGQTKSTIRSQGELSAMYGLQQLLADGKISVVVTPSADETSSGFDSSGQMRFENAAAMLDFDFTNTDDGTPVYISSYRAPFTYLKTSTFPTKPDEVFATTGGGRLIRDLSTPSYEWAAQDNWWIDKIAGNDENDGSASSPLKTGNELRRRLIALRQDKIYTINTTGNFDETDPVGVDARQIIPAYPTSTTTPSSSMTANGRVFWRGQRIVLASGTFTANGTPVNVTDIPTPGGEMPTITDSAITDWTPYIGMVLVSTSGATAGTAAVINKNIGGGVAATQEWRTIDLTATTGLGTIVAPPLSGTTYDICDHSTFVRMTGPAVSPGMALVRMRYVGSAPATEFKMSSPVLAESQVSFVECHLDFGSNTMTLVNAVQFFGTYVRQSNTLGLFLSTNKAALLCSITASLFYSSVGNVILNVGQYMLLSLSQTILRGGIRSTSNVHSAHVRTGSNVAIFDCTATQALSVGEWCMISITGGNGPFGNNNIRGVFILRGGRCIVYGSLVPALKGGAGEDLRVGPLTISSYIPTLVPSAVVPAASPMTSWAEFYSPPFSGLVIAPDQSMLHSS